MTPGNDTAITRAGIWYLWRKIIKIYYNRYVPDILSGNLLGGGGVCHLSTHWVGGNASKK